jgi:hypothetical protein
MSDAIFKEMVAYFWKKKGDPTRLSGWDEERCRQLMPSFYEAWRQCEAYRTLADLAADAGR